MIHKIKIILPYNPDCDIEIVKYRDRHCPHYEAYIMQEKHTLTYISELTREIQTLKKRYDNVLKGLKYFQAKAEKVK